MVTTTACSKARVRFRCSSAAARGEKLGASEEADCECECDSVCDRDNISGLATRGDREMGIPRPRTLRVGMMKGDSRARTTPGGTTLSLRERVVRRNEISVPIPIPKTQHHKQYNTSRVRVRMRMRKGSMQVVPFFLASVIDGRPSAGISFVLVWYDAGWIYVSKGYVWKDYVWMDVRMIGSLLSFLLSFVWLSKWRLAWIFLCYRHREMDADCCISCLRECRVSSLEWRVPSEKILRARVLLRGSRDRLVCSEPPVGCRLFCLCLHFYCRGTLGVGTGTVTPTEGTRIVAKNGRMFATTNDEESCFPFQKQ
mmetsp:Transcript_5805/g.16559  ORF Transcript_5805/g.16559 Transcript_5805/m.16559 type:complete len:312 (-) Transcript_5805:96-1031(-)